MKIEEAIDKMKRLQSEWHSSSERYQVYDMAINALSAIEDIKAEIDVVVNQEMKDDMRWACGLRYSLNIIDKHIGKESEE